VSYPRTKMQSMNGHLH